MLAKIEDYPFYENKFSNQFLVKVIKTTNYLQKWLEI